MKKLLFSMLMFCMSALQLRSQNEVRLGIGLDDSSVRNFTKWTDKKTPVLHLSILHLDTLNDFLQFTTYGEGFFSPTTLIMRGSLLGGMYVSEEAGKLSICLGPAIVNDGFHPTQKWSFATSAEFMFLVKLQYKKFWFSLKATQRVYRYNWMAASLVKANAFDGSFSANIGWTIGNIQIGVWGYSDWLGRDPAQRQYNFTTMYGVILGHLF